MAPLVIADRLDRLRDRMREACHRHGRSGEDVRLVAVSKRIALPLVADAVAAGQWDLGENRIPDALDRISALEQILTSRGINPEPLTWHFIGHLQRNKARKAAGRFALLHGVDTLELASRLAGFAEAENRREAVLLEVNISGEPQKNGVTPEGAVDLAASMARLAGLELRGMMGMARFGSDEAEQRRSFALLRELNATAAQTVGHDLPILSMGMSGDFEAAIAEGSTLVRVGTAIFGPRS